MIITILKALDKISECILTKEWIPAYFLYTYNVLNSSYDNDHIDEF